MTFQIQGKEFTKDEILEQFHQINGNDKNLPFSEMAIDPGNTHKNRLFNFLF